LKRDRFLLAIGAISAVVGIAVLLAGCVGTKFCEEDWQCIDAELHPGACIDDRRTGRYCAISSLGCPSLWRWYIDAEPSLRDKCVSTELVPPSDAGADLTPDAGTDR
jgi:hypothetical protein